MPLAGTVGRASKFFALYAFAQSDALDQVAFLQLSMACRKMARLLNDEAARRRARLRAQESSDDSEDSDSSMSEISSSSSCDGDSDGAQSPQDNDELSRNGPRGPPEY